MIRRSLRAPRCLSTLVIALLSLSAVAGAGEPEAEKDRETERSAPGELEETPAIVRGPVPIRAPRIAPFPEPGQGRLSLAFTGNRRWCTFPDDRLQESIVKESGGLKGRREVFTFGYQFSIAAVEPAQPDMTHLLYSSPEITTASLRQAGKLGRGKVPGGRGARNPVAVPDDHRPADPRQRETPATLVPYWDESQRCAIVDEQFDFDLPPGRYDLYLSFDIRIRSGAWVHRTYDYLTGVDVKEGSRTVVEGVLETRGGGRRELLLRTASIESPADEGTAPR